MSTCDPSTAPRPIVRSATRSTSARRCLVGAATLACVLASFVAPASSAPDPVATADAKIGVILPDTESSVRWETADRPNLEKAFEDAGVEYDIQNAQGDADRMAQIADSMIASGVTVLAIVNLDNASGAAIQEKAKNQGVATIDYDRLTLGGSAEYYVSFDNKRVGELQGEGLVEAMKAAGNESGDIVMINGAPTDANAADFKAGAHSVLDSSGYTVAAEYDTPDWSPDKAQSWMEGQIGTVKGDLVGVYAANDGTAGGAIAAIKAGGVGPLPPVTGQDAELAAIQRIIAGDQALTIYKAIKPQAEDAANAALALANGEAPEASADKDGVPATLLDPVVVTKDNISDTVVADGFYTVEDICTPEYADACTELGIS